MVYFFYIGLVALGCFILSAVFCFIANILGVLILRRDEFNRRVWSRVHPFFRRFF